MNVTLFTVLRLCGAPRGSGGLSPLRRVCTVVPGRRRCMPLAGLFAVAASWRAVDFQHRFAVEDLKQMVAVFVILELGVDGVDSTVSATVKGMMFGPKMVSSFSCQASAARVRSAARHPLGRGS